MKGFILAVWVLAVLAPTAAQAARRRSSTSQSRYDSSLDFSKHFDEEVKWEREHPKDEDGNPPPHAKKKSSRRRKASSTPDTEGK